ncbi:MULTISPECIES: hypothetical protein [Mycobacteroides]|uniref:Transcriptional regulator n=1 Tax=Mycobacteroides saopaulense TaxID=1578165 RepID=A0ABX3C0Y2_9MYCO|nr:MULTISPECIES: hypothetical protein [Mycobacteroides]OHT82584.1 hypothetical protein BKG68_18575 [Mycobacteroides saopaulense]OHU10126.1 hypothetical protein BKG73_09380 [Mycobacteroides saopaulense]CPS15112.1 Uncharacterised protein [Mycobacteroides abscessus]CPS52240.1 Uncharacterised protein [Mycobacteroides abscessus]CPY77615.1 Uncharacterised protein [Mycobacteroides abscessus]
MTDRSPARWDSQPLATALEVMAASGPAEGRLRFDFGQAGSVGLSLHLNPTKLSRGASDALLAQIAQLSLLAAKSTQQVIG